MSTLTELRDRVAALKGPDHETDARVHILFHPSQLWLADGGQVRPPVRAAVWEPLTTFNLDGWKDWKGLAQHIAAAPVTASVDAVLSLIERTLPGWFWDVALGIEVDGDGPYWAELYDLTTDRGHFDGDPNEYGGRTPALALLLALLEAKSSGETS